MYTYTHNVFIWHPCFLMMMSPVFGAGPSLHHFQGAQLPPTPSAPEQSGGAISIGK